MASGFWESGAAVGIFTAVGAGVGGLIAGVVTWSVTSRSITSAERLQGARLTHERDEAREARIQTRFAETYVDLLDFLTRCEETVRIQSQMFRHESDTLPPLPDDEHLMHLSAKVQAYGTDAVRAGMEKVLKARIRFQVALGTLEDTRQSSDPSGRPADVRSEREELDKSREEFLALCDQVRSDAVADLRRYRLDPS